MNKTRQGHWIDTMPCPMWGNGSDGRSVKVGYHPHVAARYETWIEEACKHEKTSIIAKRDKLGRIGYYERCNSCGCAFTSAMKHSDAHARGVSTISHDEIEAIADRYCQARRDGYDRITATVIDQVQQQNRADYDAYLRSPEWRSLRKRIYKRASGLCEGCLLRPATQTHHLTYAHKGNEFAWELVAICDACHDRISEPENG